MKNTLRLAPLLAAVLLCGLSVCSAAPQAGEAGLVRLTVLRGLHLLGPSLAITREEANCAITGSGDTASLNCKPVGVTSKSAYNYNIALIAQADGTAYVVACRIGLVSNTWCKNMQEGRILRGGASDGHFTILEGGTPRQYLLLQTAQIGPLNLDSPTPANPAPQAKAAQIAPAAPAAAPAPSAIAEPPSQPAAAPVPSTTLAAPLGDLPAACISADAALSSNSACVSFSSDPQGADIYVDGKFVGNTPSLMPLPAGTHEVRIEAPQRKPWTRTLQTAAAGKINIRAALEPADK